MSTKYGIISDLHGNYEHLQETEKFYDVDSIIINGDICVSEKTDLDIMLVMNELVKKFDEDIFVMPGCTEEHPDYSERMDYFSDGFDQFHDMKDGGVLKRDDHELVFVPGTDPEVKSGSYNISDDGLLKNSYQSNFTSIDEIEKGIDNGAKSILISHIPPKFDSDNCIDYHRFGRASVNIIENNGQLAADYILRGEDLNLEQARILKDDDYPVEIIEDNLGSEKLQDFMKRNNISKGICGHYHSNSGLANDSDGELLDEGKFYEDIFCNPCFSKNDELGVVVVDGSKMSYETLK